MSNYHLEGDDGLKAFKTQTVTPSRNYLKEDKK